MPNRTGWTTRFRFRYVIRAAPRVSRSEGLRCNQTSAVWNFVSLGPPTTRTRYPVRRTPPETRRKLPRTAVEPFPTWPAIHNASKQRDGQRRKFAETLGLYAEAGRQPTGGEFS